MRSSSPDRCALLPVERRSSVADRSISTAACAVRVCFSGRRRYSRPSDSSRLRSKRAPSYDSRSPVALATLAAAPDAAKFDQVAKTASVRSTAVMPDAATRVDPSGRSAPLFTVSPDVAAAYVPSTSPRSQSRPAGPPIPSVLCCFSALIPAVAAHALRKARTCACPCPILTAGRTR